MAPLLVILFLALFFFALWRYNKYSVNKERQRLDRLFGGLCEAHIQSHIRAGELEITEDGNFIWKESK